MSSQSGEINGAVAARVAQKQQVANTVKQWLTAMRASELSAIMIGMQLPLDYNGAVFVGRVQEELRSRGFQIASHSHAIIGTQNAGTAERPVQIPIVHLSLLIESIDHQPRRIIT